MGWHSYLNAGGRPTSEKWASNKKALQSALIWFWDAGTTYLQTFTVDWLELVTLEPHHLLEVRFLIESTIR